jgi:hypothetical protein
MFLLHNTTIWPSSIELKKKHVFWFILVMQFYKFWFVLVMPYLNLGLLCSGLHFWFILFRLVLQSPSGLLLFGPFDVGHRFFKLYFLAKLHLPSYSLGRIYVTRKKLFQTGNLNLLKFIV